MDVEAEERYRPGLLDLNLQISLTKSSHHLQYQLQSMEKLLEEYKDFKQSSCAILNFKGAVLFFLKKYKEACKIFKQVLEYDEFNLNALCNLKNIYRQLGYWTIADKYHSKMKDDHLLKATCFGEQGFAMMFDCHISGDEYERFKRSKCMFERCLEEMQDVEHEDDGLQWHLWYAQLLHKLMNTYKTETEEQKKEQFEYFKKGVECCLHIKNKINNTYQKSSDRNKHLLSMATAYTAVFTHKLDSAMKLSIGKDLSEELEAIFEEPEKAFEEAVELYQNTEVLCRYALFLRGKKSGDKQQNLEKAEQLINKALKLDIGDKSNKYEGDHGDWFALTIKSSISLAKCNLRREPNPVDSQKQPAPSNQDINIVLDTTLENWLQESIEYGEKAEQINPTSKIYSDLGEAYHWRAMNQADDGTKESYFFTALSNFMHALNHAGGNTKPYIHYNHGNCLLDMEQFYPALESFKRAIECQTQRLEQAYSKLVTCYMKVQPERINNNEMSETLKREQLLSDLAYWIGLGNKKFTHDSWFDGILNKLKENVNDKIIKSEIENALAVVARILKDRNCLPVSDKYLEENVTFAFNVFGQTLQLQNEDYIKTCLAGVDDTQILHLNEEQQTICLDHVVTACYEYRESCRNSSNKECLSKERFLIDTFEQLYAKCPKFAVKVADKIKETHSLSGDLLLAAVGKPASGPVKCEMPAEDVSMRELCFFAKQLDYSNDMQRRLFNHCISALNQRIEEMSKQDTSPISEPIVPEPKVRNKKYQYDFAVIYSENDLQWVLHSLLPTLERKYGFHGYIEGRDLLPGQSKFTTLEMFEKCYKVIVILSDDFCKDQWCCYIYQQALYGKLGEHSLIPVERSRFKEMPKELKTTISLPAVQNLDWERLVRGLE